MARKLTGTSGGDQLARWLTKNRVTQRTFGKWLSATQGVVSALLSGRRVPDGERRERIWQITGIPVAAWDRAGATREVRVRA